MGGSSFLGRLVNTELLSRRDIEGIRRAAEKFLGLYNSQAYDNIVTQIHNGKHLEAEERAALYIKLCNIWNCRIGGDARDAALKVIPKAERLAWKIDKTLEQIERSDYAQVVKPVELLVGVKGLGITSTSKILSLAKPDLYVMIDQAICHELGFANTSLGYFHYLLMMRDVARRVRELAEEAGIEDLEEYLKPKNRDWKAPLAIYLDEWNWMNITYRARQT